MDGSTHGWTFFKVGGIKILLKLYILLINVIYKQWVAFFNSYEQNKFHALLSTADEHSNLGLCWVCITRFYLSNEPLLKVINIFHWERSGSVVERLSRGERAAD